MANAPLGDLNDAMNRLDSDIAETERRLAQLRSMRDSLQPFIEQYLHVGLHDPAVGVTERATPEPEHKSRVEHIAAVFLENPGKTLSVDDVCDALHVQGIEIERDAVRNSIHYARKRGVVELGKRRGTYVLKDTSTPVASGVEVSGEPESKSSLREEGGSRHGSTLLHDQDGATHDAPFRLGRDDDRASIGG